jgi:hypothetical protein
MRRWLGAARGASLEGLRLAIVGFALTSLDACDKGEAAPPEGPLGIPSAADEDVAELSKHPVAAPAPDPPPARVAARDGGADVDAGPSRAEAPLLWWMQENPAAALRQGDNAAVATALDRLATFAPPDPPYTNWASIARDGADAARAASLDGVKAACRGCHEQYRNAYKSGLRARPLVPGAGARQPG